MPAQLPPLDHMRTVLRIGMSKDEFFTACDDLMEHYQLRVGSPAASNTLVSIHVAEGDVLLCYLHGPGNTLSYVEYRGGIFMGE